MKTLNKIIDEYPDDAANEARENMREVCHEDIEQDFPMKISSEAQGCKRRLSTKGTHEVRR